MKPQDVVFASEAEKERFAIASQQPRFTRGQQKLLLVGITAICLSLVSGSVYYAATSEAPEVAEGASKVDPKTGKTDAAGEAAVRKRAKEKLRARPLEENMSMSDRANTTGQKAEDFYVNPLEAPE